jgi:hypothetical protein
METRGTEDGRYFFGGKGERDEVVRGKGERDEFVMRTIVELTIF